MKTKDGSGHGGCAGISVHSGSGEMHTQLSGAGVWSACGMEKYGEVQCVLAKVCNRVSEESTVQCSVC